METATTFAQALGRRLESLRPHSEPRVLLGYPSEEEAPALLACLTEPLRRCGVTVVLIAEAFPSLLALFAHELDFDVALNLETIPVIGGGITAYYQRIEENTVRLRFAYTGQGVLAPERDPLFPQATARDSQDISQEMVDTTQKASERKGSVAIAMAMQAYHDKVFDCANRIGQLHPVQDSAPAELPLAWVVSDAPVRKALTCQSHMDQELKAVGTYPNLEQATKMCPNGLAIAIHTNGQEVREYRITQGQATPLESWDTWLTIAQFIRPALGAQFIATNCVVPNAAGAALKSSGWEVQRFRDFYLTVDEVASASDACMMMDRDHRLICRLSCYPSINDAVFAGVLLAKAHSLQAASAM